MFVLVAWEQLFSHSLIVILATDAGHLSLLDNEQSALIMAGDIQAIDGAAFSQI